MPDSMMAEIMAGEEFISTDSLIGFLQGQPDLQLKYQLGFEYLTKGDTNSLNNTLSSIPNIFSLNSQQTNVHNDYLSYFGVMKKLLKNGKNIYTMDSLSVLSIQGLSANAAEPVKSFTRYILIANGLLTYHEPILLPDELKSGKIRKQYITSRFIEKSYIRVFPNPAKQYIIVEYNFKEIFRDKSEIILTVRNINGALLYSKNLFKRQDQELISTSSFTNGSYVCSIIFNGKVIDTEKFVVLQ